MYLPTPGWPSRSPLMLLVALALVAGVGLALAGGRPASAAVIDGAVRDITVTPTNPRPSQPIRTTIDWCVPNGTEAGDTFTITMPEQLGGFPPTFPLLDPSGELVATATVGGDPVTATFTMTDYAETRVGVCGDAFFESRMDANEVADTTQTLVYEVNGDLTFERTIVVQAAGGPVRTQGVKRGEWADPDDQCRTATANCIEWVLTTRVGPYDSVEFNDLAADGLAFSCADLSVVYWTVNPDGTRGDSFAPSAVGATSDVDCTPGEVTVVTGPVPADMLVRLRIPASPDTPAPAGGVVYSNIASISHTTDEDVISDEVDAESRSAVAGGSGSGVGIDIEKYDTDGNDADTVAESVNVPDGTADLVFTITNTGGDALVDVVVGDVILTGGATVTGLTCDFSMAAAGAPTSGTTWDGPFPPGAQFDCTAQLSGVEAGVPHANRASVTGVGQASGEVVDDEDDYHANRTPLPTTVPPTTVVAETTTTVAQRPPTTPPAPTTTAISPERVPLPATGSSTVIVGVALALLAAGAVLAGIAVRRRPVNRI